MKEEFNHQLLIVDDDDRIRTLLKKILTKEGYYVVAAPSAAEARDILKNFNFDLIILDRMMPNEDGVTFLKWLRANDYLLPIIMLTAMGEVADKLTGLEGGATDYMAKPFEIKELILRINNILALYENINKLERKEPVSVATKYYLGDIEIDISKEQVMHKNGDIIYLTEKESSILFALAKASPEPVKRYDLTKNTEDQGRALDVIITRIRRKIPDDPKSPKWLKTVRGEGYKLLPD